VPRPVRVAVSVVALAALLYLRVLIRHREPAVPWRVGAAAVALLLLVWAVSPHPRLRARLRRLGRRLGIR
jgi:hypothetical protein